MIGSARDIAEAAKAAEKRAQPEIERKRAVQAKRTMRDIMGKLDEGMDIASMMSMPLDQVAGLLDVAPAVLAGVLATLAGKSGGLPNMDKAEEKETEIKANVLLIPVQKSRRKIARRDRKFRTSRN